LSRPNSLVELVKPPRFLLKLNGIPNVNRLGLLLLVGKQSKPQKDEPTILGLRWHLRHISSVFVGWELGTKFEVIGIYFGIRLGLCKHLRPQTSESTTQNFCEHTVQIL